MTSVAVFSSTPAEIFCVDATKVPTIRASTVRPSFLTLRGLLQSAFSRVTFPPAPKNGRGNK